MGSPIFNIKLAELRGEIVDVEPWEVQNALTLDITARDAARQEDIARSRKAARMARQRRERREERAIKALMLVGFVVCFVLPLFFG